MGLINRWLSRREDRRRRELEALVNHLRLVCLAALIEAGVRPNDLNPEMELFDQAFATPLLLAR